MSGIYIAVKPLVSSMSTAQCWHLKIFFEKKINCYTIMHFVSLSMYKLIIISLLNLLLLCSCASLYETPKSHEAAAVIRPKDERSGVFNWSVTEVHKIDNKLAGIGLSNTTRIYPGNHTITVRTEFNQGFMSGGPYEAFTDVNADFKANMNYFIHSKVQGSRLLVWVVDNSGNKVSEVVSSAYHTKAQNQTIFIPTTR